MNDTIWTGGDRPRVEVDPALIVRLEHSDVLISAHPMGKCAGIHCTVHARSNHSMRDFPQHWRSDRGIMERTCPHGVGHPDPDEINLDRTHGCCIEQCCYNPQGKQLLRIKKRKIATDFVNSINKVTYCAVCGEQPIEWHKPGHVQKPNDRISSLRTQGASVDKINKEMEVCTPLCRTHHMQEDGRMKKLRENQPYQKDKVYVLPAPCSCCGKVYKQLRNTMCSTCDSHKSGRRLRKTKSCDGCCEGAYV